MNGYLFLKNASGIGWGQFWFTLDSETLIWRVDNEDDFIIGTIVLKDVKEFISIEGPDGSENVISMDTNGRLYSFKTANADMHSVWCDAIVRRLPPDCGTNGYTVEPEPQPRISLLQLALSRPDPVALHELFVSSDYVLDKDLPELLAAQLNVKLMANELHHLSKEIGVQLDGEDESRTYFEVNSFCEVMLWLERASDLVLTLSDIPIEKTSQDWLSRVPVQEIWARLCRVSVVPVLRLVAQLSAETADNMHVVVSTWARPVVTPKTFAELLEKMDIAIDPEQVPTFVAFLGLAHEKEFIVETIVQRFAHLQRAFRLLFTLTLCVAQHNSPNYTRGGGDDTVDTYISNQYDETFGTVSSGEFNTDYLGDNSLPSWPSTMQQSIPIENDPACHANHHYTANGASGEDVQFIPAYRCLGGVNGSMGSNGHTNGNHAHPHIHHAEHQEPNGVIQRADGIENLNALAVTPNQQRDGNGVHADRRGPWGGRIQDLQHRDRRNTEPVGRTSATSSSEDIHELKEGFRIPEDKEKSPGSQGRPPAQSVGGAVTGEALDTNKPPGGVPGRTRKNLVRQNTTPTPRRRSTSAWTDLHKNDEQAMSDYVSVLEEQLADEREARQRIEIAYIELENELHVERVQERRASRANGVGNPRSDLSQLSLQHESTPLLHKMEVKCFRFCSIQ